MSSFQFIHAADLHIDSPMRGLGHYEGAPVDSAQQAPRQAFTNLIDQAIQLKVAFIVLSGDISDGDNNQVSTALFFVAQCARAAAEGIQVYLIWGNHDADSDLFKKLPLPEGVHAFSAKKPEQKLLEAHRVVLTGQSYPRRAVMDNMAEQYPGARPGHFNLALLHTSLTGAEGHEPYAPCTVEHLRAKGMDYWALGHVHTRAIVDQKPYVVFPGNLQGRSVRETGERGALLVSVSDGRVQRIEPLAVDTMRWTQLTLDVSGAESLNDLARAAREQFDTAVGEADGRVVAARVLLTGRTSLHSQIFRRQDEVRAHLLAVVQQGLGDRLWLEKVKTSTQPMRSAEEIAAQSDSLAALQKLLADAADDPDLHESLKKVLGGVPAALPNEVRADLEVIDLIDKGLWGEFVRRAAPSLIEALAAGE